ncbi:MAG: sugar phosphate isomerase/epimerase [Ruminococcaceae bacterium]|nr:sugar phosphate isomerase/epimerase [Oscillospiraceae bacterium]MBO4972734.1 sugar phosphate isomerase/epimerase [Clostridia bacterium]
MLELGVIMSMSGDLDEKFKKVHDLGLTSCQLSNYEPSVFTDENAAIVNECSKKYGVRVSALWCGWPGPKVWNFVEGPATLGIVPVAYRFERVKMLLKGGEFALKIGVTDVATHAGFIPENPSTTEYLDVVGCIKHIAKNYLDKGLYFLFETGQETPTTLLRLIEDVGTGNLGINLDPANLLMYGKANPCDAVDIFGKYIRNVHGKDGNYPTDGRSLGREARMGDGKVNYPELMRRLKAAGYNGPITIEREIKGDKQVEDILHAKAMLTALYSEIYGEEA